MIQHIAIQISIYLVSLWLTILPTLSSAAYQILTRTVPYNLHIFSNCVFALQGFIMNMIYFTLQRFEMPKVECETSSRSRLMGGQLTVRDIRQSSVRRGAKSGSKVTN